MGKLAHLNDQELLEKFKTCEDEYYVFKTAGNKTGMKMMVWKIIAVKKEMEKRGLDDPALGKTKYQHGLSIYGKPKALNVIQFWPSTEQSFKAATYAHGKSVVITWLTATEWLCCSKEAISLLIASGVISEPYPEYLVLADVAHVKNLDAIEQASRFGKTMKFKVMKDYQDEVEVLEYWDGHGWKKMPSVEPSP